MEDYPAAAAGTPRGGGVIRSADHPERIAPLHAPWAAVLGGREWYALRWAFENRICGDRHVHSAATDAGLEAWLLNTYIAARPVPVGSSYSACRDRAAVDMVGTWALLTSLLRASAAPLAELPIWQRSAAPTPTPIEAAALIRRMITRGTSWAECERWIDYGVTDTALWGRLAEGMPLAWAAAAQRARDEARPLNA